ncbi:MAG: chromosomal replication initiator DnaA [Pseudorhodoplanes sp.]
MTVALAPRQLALALEHPVSFAREDFVAGAANAAALATIERYPDWPGRHLMLAGPHGSGKSHLAAIWAELAGARMVSARVLQREDVPGALVTGALVLEDAEPGAFDEAAVFHLLNLARQERAALLLTGRLPPSAWDVALPDLCSRLRAVPVVAMAAPDDALLRAVLVKLFADRQVNAEEALVSFLLGRIERSFPAARQAVDRLDREALRRQRPVTRLLAAELLRS